MTKPKFPGEPLIINFEKIESEILGTKIDKIFNESDSEPLNNIFDDVRRLLKLNFENIVNKLLSKPNKVFKISSDIDTISIREQVSNLDNTCFFEDGRIFAYSNFLNEVVFGIQNWLFVENFESKALSFLFANYEITIDQLYRIFGVDYVDSLDYLDNLYCILRYSENLSKFFDVEVEPDRICLYPKENLIDSLLAFKRTLIH